LECLEFGVPRVKERSEVVLSFPDQNRNRHHSNRASFDFRHSRHFEF